MGLQSTKNTQAQGETSRCAQSQREQIKQEIRQRIQDTLQAVRDLPSNDCLNETRNKLSAVELYCQSVGKTLVVQRTFLSLTMDSLDDQNSG